MIMYARKIDLAMDVAKSHLGRWYKWGGDDPSGFDCSGLVLEVLQSVGIISRGTDMTAANLYELFKDTETQTPVDGCLLFWKSGDKIVHVEMVLAKIGEELFTIGASGGGSNTKTIEDAIAQNAFIKVRPAREGWAHAVNPFWRR